MEGNIFSNRKERELQNLRQRQASNIITVDPNLRGFTRRFDPDVSRASLLQLQRSRVPTKAELEKSVGVKTVKKLKKRKKKNLRGEAARNLTQQRRFERGERRDKPEQEPRIVGDPAPAAPGAPAAPAAPAADPNAQLRLAIEGRRIASQEAQQRRLVDAIMDRDDRERGERQAILDRQADERQAIIGRSEVERQALLDRQGALAGEERQERLAILDREGQERLAILDRQERLTEEERGERQALIGRAEAASAGAQAERQELRGAFRTILEGETAFARRERQDFLDQSEAERAVLRREAREERVALLDDRRGLEQSQEAIRDRVEQQRIAERRQAAAERDELLGRGARALERLGDEERRERVQREDQQAAAQVAERQRQQAERTQIDVQAAEEREGILRLTLDSDRDPVPESPRPEPGNTQADRDFIQRQFQQGLEQVDRRIGESEARTAEQIRQHADRVTAVERQPPIIIQQPPINIEQPAAPAQQPGPSAAEIAVGVRDALQDLDLQPSPRRRVDIEEETTDTESETFSPTRTQRDKRGRHRPDDPRAETFFRDQDPDEEAQGFSPVQRVKVKPGQQPTPQSTGQDIGDLFPEGLPPPQEGGGEERGEAEPEQVVAEPAQLPSQRIPELEEQQGSAPGGERRVIPTGDPEQLPRAFAEIEGSGVVVDRSNLPQEGGQDLFQSGLFSGNLEAAAQNAIGFVGDVAGRAGAGIANLVNPPPQVGDQTGGALTDAEGNPIFGLGQEIEEPVRPTIQPLQSEQPVRRVETSRSPRAGGGGRADTRSKLQKDKDALKGAEAQERRLQTAQKASKIANVSGGRQAFGAKGELKKVQQKIKDLQGRIQSEEIQVRNRESMRHGAALGGGIRGGSARGAAGGARGLVEEEEEGEAVARVAPSARRTNLQLYDELIPEIQGSYTRGRAQGGARGSLPYQISNTSDRVFKGLQPGQTATIDQIESDGRLGYYPRGRTAGKTGITRIGEAELKKHVTSGKLKVDRTR